MTATTTTTGAARPVFGPYDTDVDTLGEPMPTHVRELHGSGRVRSGDPDHVVRDAGLEALLAACHGIELGAYDARVLTWLADLADPSSLQAVIGVITRVAAAAGRGMAEEIARACEEPPAMSNREMSALIRADDDEDRAAEVVGVVLGYAAGVARRVGGVV